ncbi:MAG: hypothetical protein RLN60_01785 [Phycisphaerales bacterium]
MLRQVLGELDLTFWPKISLVIFFVVFAVIFWHVWTLNRRMDVDAAAGMPLDDAERTTATPSAHREVKP